MFRRFSANFAVFSIFLDYILVAIALFLAAVLRYPLNNYLPFLKELGAPASIPWPLYAIFPAIWVIILLIFSQYDGRRNLRIANEFSTLSMGTLLAAVAMAGVLYFSFRDVSRFLFLLFVFLAFGMMVIWRATVRLAFRWNVLQGSRTRRVLILGAGVIGRRLQVMLLEQASLGLTLVGFLDDDVKKQAQFGKEVLGSLDLAREAILRLKVNDVVIALPLSAHQRLLDVVGVLHDLPVQVWVIPDYFSLTLHRASVQDFAGIPMMDLRAPALSEYQRMIKRGFDLLVTLFLMPFVLPVIGVIAIAIQRDSPGPVFFRPIRVGENGSKFRMIKFRTMVVGAEKMQHTVEKLDADGNLIFKMPDDPRVTRVGRFLRRTSLDELPQLFNVFKGEMSLVGPRPEMPELVEKYDLWQRKRFAVPQGMTGWWQINGRSDKPMHLHTEEDLYYVQHYSIWLDLQILVMTMWAVLRGRGAY
jgi:exopolysaccharide biosynthesis polyprenyl glycosylphosphotransferase